MQTQVERARADAAAPAVPLAAARRGDRLLRRRVDPRQPPPPGGDGLRRPARLDELRRLGGARRAHARAGRVPRDDRACSSSRFDATVGFLAGRRRPALLQRPDRDPRRRAAGRPARLRAARGDGGADAALAQARPRARLRRRHRARLCDVWRGRLRGPLRLRRDRRRHEPRLAARRRGDRRPDPRSPSACMPRSRSTWRWSRSAR